ncbi:MAG TPA: GNAT family N-acetyltransferase [Euzebyales bacterium]|nr:GNAT family N-acetyltransferase [Euzebyales bacterium]
MGDVHIDAVSDPASCRVVEDIQRAAWGMADRGVVPAEQIRAVIHNGGLLLLATVDGTAVGFCYGFVGLDAGRPILCSHMLAVLPEAQSQGIGRALKLAQRQHAATRGFTAITWTFDPLQARNAYLNLRRLGAVASHYHVDHYGPMDDAINAGLSTDRLLAEWAIDARGDPRLPTPTAGVPWALPPALDAAEGVRPGRHDPSVFGTGAALIAMPSDIDQLRRDDPDAGPVWRTALRTALVAAFEAGLTAVDVVPDAAPGYAAYVVERDT